MRTQGLSDAFMYQNMTTGGDEPIMVNVTLPDGSTKYIFSIHTGKAIELFDANARKTLWKADLSSIC